MLQRRAALRVTDPNHVVNSNRRDEDHGGCGEPSERFGMPSQRDRKHHATGGQHEQRPQRKPVRHDRDRRPDHDRVSSCLSGRRRRERDGHKGQQEPKERVRRVRLQLDGVKGDPLADRTEHYQYGAGLRRQPPSSDVESRDDGRHAKGRREGPHGQLRRSECQQDEPLEKKPAHRSALIEPQPAAQTGERAIAEVQRDHLFVEPQRTRSRPLMDDDGHTNRRHQDGHPCRKLISPRGLRLAIHALASLSASRLER